VFCADEVQRPERCDADDVRQLVASLYQTVNSEQYYNTQQRLLLARQEQLRSQLEPLEKVRPRFFKCTLLQSVVTPFSPPVG